jgi:hypothetical protein
MSDEQIEAAIEVITDMLAKREAGENARVIEATRFALPCAFPGLRSIPDIPGRLPALDAPRTGDFKLAGN